MRTFSFSSLSASRILSKRLLKAAAKDDSFVISYKDLMNQRIILFGDSLTQFGSDEGGWASKLAWDFVRKADVINRGFSGYNTEWCKHLLPKIIEDDFPKDLSELLLVTILLGSNDACEPPSKQHVPLETYKANLRFMVDMIRGKYSKDTPIMLITPPPIHEERWIEACTLKGRRSFLHPKTTERYRNACMEVAAELNVSVLDTWSFIPGPVDLEEILYDGLHFSKKGNHLLYTKMTDFIKKKFGLDASKLKPRIALWGDVDAEKIPSSLFQE